MQPNQLFTLVASALASVGFAVAMLVLILLDEPSKVPTDELRSSLPPAPQLIAVPRPRPAMRASRFAYVPPEARDFEVLAPGPGSVGLPEETEEVAADPESWAVEITEQAMTRSKTHRPDAASRSGSSRRRAKTRKRRYTLRQRLNEISPIAKARLAGRFAAAKVVWPPTKVTLVAIKDEKVLELYSQSGDDDWKFVHRYRVLAASGKSGPKLRRGDKQVPEGIYRISYLNPNSAYHVSLRVNYPNAFDREKAKKDGRKDLGGDIMIHGKNVSAGCLAMGDRTSEELFVLAAEVGMKNVKLVIAPTDFRRKKQTPVSEKGPGWVPELYTEIADAMSEYKAPPEPSLLTLLGF